MVENLPLILLILSGIEARITHTDDCQLIFVLDSISFLFVLVDLSVIGELLRFNAVRWCEMGPKIRREDLQD